MKALRSRAGRDGSRFRVPSWAPTNREVGTGNVPLRYPDPGPLTVIHIASGREWRGGQRQLSYLARALLAAPGVNQVVVTGRGSRLATELLRAGVKVSPTAWHAAFDPRALAHLFRELHRLGEGQPILHAHDSHALTLAGVASFVTGRALVATRRVDVPLRRTGFWRSTRLRQVCPSGATRDARSLSTSTR